MATQCQEVAQETTQSTIAIAKQDEATFLGKIGWGMIAGALALWGVTTVLLLYGGASAQIGWGMLAAFGVLLGGGLVILAVSRPIERFLVRRRASRAEPILLPVGGVWKEAWN